MTKVSVVTRTKDRPVTYLERTIKSVHGQSFKDFTHVIINDGGDVSRLDGFIGKLDESVRARIKVFHRSISSNAPDTIFNESIDRVESKYFAIHDDDDSWHPDFLKTTVEFLDDNNEHGAVVVRTDKITERYNGKSGILQTKRKQYMPDVRAVSLYRQCIDNQLTPISTLYRRSSYEQVGKFDPSLPVVGDWEFGIRLLKHFEVGFVDPGHALAGYHHRVSTDNSFTRHDHRTYITKVLNLYLRDDIKEGRSGLGQIMNQLRYEQDMIAGLIKKLTPAVVVNRIRKKIRN